MISNIRIFFLFSLITPRPENSRIEIPFPSLLNGREQKKKINQNSNKKKKKEEKENLAERETVGIECARTRSIGIRGRVLSVRNAVLGFTGGASLLRHCTPVSHHAP